MNFDDRFVGDPKICGGHDNGHRKTSLAVPMDRLAGN